MLNIRDAPRRSAQQPAGLRCGRLIEKPRKLHHFMPTGLSDDFARRLHLTQRPHLRNNNKNGSCRHEGQNEARRVGGTSLDPQSTKLVFGLHEQIRRCVLLS